MFSLTNIIVKYLTKKNNYPNRPDEPIDSIVLDIKEKNNRKKNNLRKSM